MATLPTFDTFNAGETVTAAKLNKNIRDAGTFLINPPSLRLNANVAQSQATSAWTTLTYNVEDEDTDGMWTSGSNITCNTSGLYQVNASSTWAVNTTGSRLVRFAVNGVALNGRASSSGVATYETSVSLSKCVRLAVGDVFTVQTWHNVGSALNSYVSADARNTLEMVWVSQ